MAANNMVNPAVDPNREDELFALEVDQIKKWWSDPRWRYTKRPFTAEQIASKRGNLKIEYASNAQSKKLWNILENRFQVRDRDSPSKPHEIAESMANSDCDRPRMLATPTAAWSPPPSLRWPSISTPSTSRVGNRRLPPLRLTSLARISQITPT